jgi:hypothetical protein
MRPDAVEIKITFDKPHVRAAIDGFGPMPDRHARSVYFCEDVTGDVLASAPAARWERDPARSFHRRQRGRLHHQAAPEPADATHRPLAQSSQGQQTDFKIEADWTSDQRVLAVSFTRKLPDGLLCAVLDGDEPVRHLFSDDQEQFLADCGSARINLAVVTMLPLVAANPLGTISHGAAGSQAQDRGRALDGGRQPGFLRTLGGSRSRRCRAEESRVRGVRPKPWL